MKPLSAEQIRGNWATLIVPWKEDDSLDLPRLATEIDTLIAMQVDGIYSHGTAGEFHCQSEEEFDLVSGLLADKCNAANMPFQIGVSHMSAQISLARLKRAISLKPSAVQVIVPDWFPPTNQEIVTFLQRMAEAAGEIGMVLYNPPHAKRVLTPVEIGNLAAQVPSLIGLKTAGGDAAWYASMREHLSDLSVFVPGHLLASGIKQGAHGAYSNVACLNPAVAQRWTDQMQTDLPGALELEQRLRAFMAEHIAPFITRDHYCNAACDRLLSQIGGWAYVGTTMRWPYRSIPTSEAERLRPIAKEMLPEFFQANWQSAAVTC
ncbi:dihydrodipicolinate synthase family protein [Bremerella cremea]|uniref:Dihydrodipicolinate synthase family protein n=1 Tax=Bremerella cremea TaxID=1031537 RepID=A0A368KNI3_9BACT|nr:dihydrodipicolinate synthase family protein [Bremerella cremea]RCS41513.1 dihydrodipicolinate synthase family protein [Bremerella cremea]